MSTPYRIGDILIDKGLITPEQLEYALSVQKEKGGRIGWIIMSLGLISRQALFKTLAEHFGLPFRYVNPKRFDDIGDLKLLEKVTPEEVTKYQAIPARQDGSRLFLLTAVPEASFTLDFFKERYQVESIQQIVVTDLDITHLAERYYKTQIIDFARFGLFYRNPGESAINTVTRPQVAFFAFLILAGLTWLYHDATSMFGFLLIALQAFYLVIIGFRTVLTIVGAQNEMVEPVTAEDVAALADADLPVYTVLIPAYREPETLPSLIEAVRRIDYPQSKLDVLLILEEDDQATLEAAKKAAPPGTWRFIIVPESQPKTKPKACNYGVYFARGKYLTIFDAEDIPDSDQLKKAVIAFRRNPDNFICFQAALNYYNYDENFITRMFTLEYSYWFDYLLPGLDKMKLPIPLGGTSNHFRVDYLRDLGAWDSFNTTEDADLGIRAAANGLKVGVINATTYEEANSRFNNWVRQRSRWIKGYMQTALVFNRNPIRLLRKLGLKNWLAFQLFITGTPILFIVNPILWAMFLVWLLTQTKLMDPLFTPLLTYLALTNLLTGNFMGIYLNMLAVFRRGLFPLLPYALLNPFYWLIFHTTAAYKALWQLFVKPHFWEKTQHGLSKVAPIDH